VGARGPQPTPAAILEARGSHRAAERRATEVTTAISIPVKDDQIFDDLASQKWDEIVEHLEALGVISYADRHILVRYCVIYSRWYQLEMTLKKRGQQVFAIRNKKGEIVEMRPFPEAKLAAHLFDQMLKIEDRFGLSPASRASIRTKTIIDMAIRKEDPLPQSRSKDRFFE
jgi:P27 family predicted phage terminase small subunit